MKLITNEIKKNLNLELEINYHPGDPKEDGIWIVWNEEFLMHGAGETRDEAIEDFWISLDVIFEHYINTPDRDMTLDGLELKNKIKNRIEAVKQLESCPKLKKEKV